MIKPILFTLISILFLNVALAQNIDSLFLYVNTDGRLVPKEQANAYFLVLQPDSSVDKSLFRIHEYYADGKLMLLATSSTDYINFKYQGHYIAYYPNGKKRRIGTFEDGHSIGDEVNYYPNGKFANSTKHLKNNHII